MEGRLAGVGAARVVYGEVSSSSSPSTSSLSGAEDDASRDVLLLGVGWAELWRLWAAAPAGAPRLRQACGDAARDLAAWTRRGGALCALLVVSVGSASLAALTGLLVVVFFVAAATTTAIVFSLLVPLVAAGGLLAAVLASIYVGALSVAVFAVATTTAVTIIVITIATGWAVFFWIIWFAATRCLGLIIT